MKIPMIATFTLAAALGVSGSVAHARRRPNAAPTAQAQSAVDYQKKKSQDAVVGLLKGPQYQLKGDLYVLTRATSGNSQPAQFITLVFHFKNKGQLDVYQVQSTYTQKSGHLIGEIKNNTPQKQSYTEQNKPFKVQDLTFKLSGGQLWLKIPEGFKPVLAAPKNQ